MTWDKIYLELTIQGVRRPPDRKDWEALPSLNSGCRQWDGQPEFKGRRVALPLDLRLDLRPVKFHFDLLAHGLLLAVDAPLVDAVDHLGRVADPTGDLRYGHASVQPRRDARVANSPRANTVATAGLCPMRASASPGITGKRAPSAEVHEERSAHKVDERAPSVLGD